MSLPGLYPPARYLPVPDDHHGGLLKDPLGVIYHVQVGYGSLAHYFANSEPKVSSHLWMSRTGVIEQYVDLRLCSYAQGKGNGKWVAVEMEGYPASSYTEAQLNAAADFYEWFMSYTGRPAQITDNILIPGLGTHQMGGAAWGGHECPGAIRAGQRQEIINRIGRDKPEVITPDDRDAVALEAANLVWISAPVTLNSDPNVDAVRQPDMRHVVEQSYVKAGKLQTEAAWTRTALGLIAASLNIELPPFPE